VLCVSDSHSYFGVECAGSVAKRLSVLPRACSDSTNLVGYRITGVFSPEFFKISSVQFLTSGVIVLDKTTLVRVGNNPVSCLSSCHRYEKVL
jgi:hypothetical protein